MDDEIMFTHNAGAVALFQPFHCSGAYGLDLQAFCQEIAGSSMLGACILAPTATALT